MFIFCLLVCFKYVVSEALCDAYWSSFVYAQSRGVWLQLFDCHWLPNDSR